MLLPREVCSAEAQPTTASTTLLSQNTTFKHRRCLLRRGVFTSVGRRRIHPVRSGFLVKDPLCDRRYGKTVEGTCTMLLQMLLDGDSSLCQRSASCCFYLGFLDDICVDIPWVSLRLLGCHGHDLSGLYRRTGSFILSVTVGFGPGYYCIPTRSSDIQRSFM
jgi:hypothetical protein